MAWFFIHHKNFFNLNKKKKLNYGKKKYNKSKEYNRSEKLFIK